MPTYSPLLTDHYQIMMAYSYWKLGMAEQEAVFHLSFRKLPNHTSYIVAAGLEKVIDFLEHFTFTQGDIAFLRNLTHDTKPLFPETFLDYLTKLRFSCDLDAIPEGTLIYALEPVIRIKGPILQCQLLESPLLNFINFASLIATKASLIYVAAGGTPIIEYGLRRAQGPDGALTASRSAYIGGCSSTSNVLAGMQYGIPTQGTQAHSWIMAFPTEKEAFEKFAEVMKGSTTLLVDTYDTIEGVKHAIEIGLELKRKGEHLVAIRLDSGNLLELSRKARRLLDQAGLNSTKIIASGDLDETIITRLKVNDAPIDAWGVGTKLVTSYDQPALNAIYKLTALRDQNGNWDYKMKLSNDPQKSTLPGILQVRRIYQNDVAIKDIIYDIHITEGDVQEGQGEDLLKPIFNQGKLIYQSLKLEEIRKNLVLKLETYVEQSSKPYQVSLGCNMQKNTQKIVAAIKKRNF